MGQVFGQGTEGKTYICSIMSRPQGNSSLGGITARGCLDLSLSPPNPQHLQVANLGFLTARQPLLWQFGLHEAKAEPDNPLKD